MMRENWPPLPYELWKDTYATLHMWIQVAGKVALAFAPPVNHSWQVALQVTPRGLSTYSLPCEDRNFSLEFDFIDHKFIVRMSDGTVESLPLSPRSVAQFYRDVLDLLRGMGLSVDIWPMPVEIPDPIRFDLDEVHHSYVPEHANRLWRILVQIQRVFTQTRCKFVGKASPVHFFWGSFDLAVTRFSGRPAPDREGPEFMREAYSQEVISHGFWPGGSIFPEPVFYMYAVPEPPGLKEVGVQPAGAYYHNELGEFLLPYETVRSSSDPEAAIEAFVESTYSHAANLGDWDRRKLERTIA